MNRRSYFESDGSVFQQTGEDQELTDFVNHKIAELFSTRHEPMPSSCPRCNGTKIRTRGLHRRVKDRFAKFYCDQCRRTFTRLFGTPFIGRFYTEKLDVFIPMLSQPISFKAAGACMGSNLSEIKKRVLAIRHWLLELDPSGRWEKRVRLGGRLGELRSSTIRFVEEGAQEDTLLTQRLTEAFDTINSLVVHPFPSCAYCGSLDVSYAPNKSSAFPRYRCSACSRNFSRRTGTAFAKSKGKNLERMREAIRYMSLPLSFVQVSDELSVFEPSTIEHWRNCFVALANELEPAGSLSSRIRLGVEPTDATPCPFCGRTGTAVKRASAWACAGCGRLFSMRRSIIEQDGLLKITGEIDSA